jgi:hypothetical protein
MRFEVSRLRRGEWIVGASAIALVVLMFVAPWYGLSGARKTAAHAHGQATSLNAFDGLTDLRWLMLITIAFASGLMFLQGTRRAPALPVSFSVFVTVLGGLTSLCLIYRVLINPPDGFERRPAAYLGLLSVLVLAYGAFRSMREEDRPDPARNAAIESVRLDQTP